MRKRLISNLIMAVPMVVFAQQQLTLDQCHQLALKNNYEIKIAREEVQAAEHNVKSSRTLFLPKFSFTGTYLHNDESIKYRIDEMALPVGNADGTFRPDQLTTLTDAAGNLVPYPMNWVHIPSTDLTFGQKDLYLLNLGLVQPLFTGGKILQQYKISQSTAKISKAQKWLTDSDVLLQTSELFWKIVSIEEKVILAESYVALIEDHLTILNNYLGEGIITSNELLKAMVRLNEAKMNLLKAQNGRDLAKMALCRHLGLPIDSTIELKTEKMDDYSVIDNQYSGDEFANQRNELKMLQESVNITKSMEQVALSGYLPNLVLTGNYTTLNPNPYNSLKEEFGGGWNVGLSAQFDIFSWNERGHKVASARHTRKAAEQKLEDTQNLIKLDIQQSVYKVNEIVRQIRLAESTLSQAEKNLQITRDNFREGIATSTDVLDAQILWQRANSELIDSNSEYQINLAKYYKAIGQK
ncbi:MAG: TolC family protein [Candidatus Marinimicrobia bacterium]|nr:TolC family protein [Candidatus Neomarinimicrobiota bacterium]